jgi:hypothetical protein
MVRLTRSSAERVSMNRAQERQMRRTHVEIVLYEDSTDDLRSMEEHGDLPSQPGKTLRVWVVTVKWDLLQILALHQPTATLR